MDARKRNFLLAAIVVIGVVAALYYSDQPMECTSFECFADHMSRCAKATYINEEPKATWKYEITREIGDECNIEVTLEQAKEGNLRLLEFEDDSMICVYPVGTVDYPDRDLEMCSGKLKEDLQTVIIEKLHAYIIDNIGQIAQEVNSQ